MGQRKPNLDTIVAEWARKVKRPLRPDEARRLAALLRVMLRMEKQPQHDRARSLRH